MDVKERVSPSIRRIDSLLTRGEYLCSVRSGTIPAPSAASSAKYDGGQPNGTPSKSSAEKSLFAGAGERGRR